MDTFAGCTQMGSMPAAAGARARGQLSLAPTAAWQLAGVVAASSKRDIPTFVDPTATHRHRRPWEPS